MTTEIKMRIAERRAQRLLRGIQEGWNEIPRDRAVRVEVRDAQRYGVVIIEWRGQAPMFGANARKRK